MDGELRGRLAGKTALVTGAASGFGEGIARLFAAEGASVVVADLDRERGARVVDEIGEDGGEASFIRADVSRREDVQAMVEESVRAYERLDILVNNAGAAHRNKPMLDVTEEEFDRVYAVNVKAIYLAALEAVPVLRRQGGGAILNMSSTAALRPRPGLTVYNGSKGAVNVLTKSMAAEFAGDGIRVNALCPVMGETGLLETFMGMSDTPENRAKFIASIPMGRFSTARDLAGAALFLCSDDAAFVTGVTLEVDGGRSI